MFKSVFKSMFLNQCYSIVSNDNQGNINPPITGFYYVDNAGNNYTDNSGNKYVSDNS